MQEIVAYCGIVCTECPAYEATKKDDDEARAKVAEEWSRQFQHNFKADDINCSGCLAVGDVQFGYCSMCEIRKCGSYREVSNCAYCVDYPCDRLSDFLAKVPDAKAKLNAIRNRKKGVRMLATLTPGVRLLHAAGFFSIKEPLFR